MRAALLVALAACGGTSTVAPAPHATSATPTATAVPPAGPETRTPPERPASPIGDAAAALPLGILGLSPLDITWIAHVPDKEKDEVVGYLFGKDRYSFISNKAAEDCARPIVPRMTAAYEPVLDPTIVLTHPQLIFAGNIDEISKCLTKIGGKRRKTKDKRMARFEMVVLTQLSADWLLVTDDERGLDQLLATTSTAPNPLGRLTTTVPTARTWITHAIDYTWEVFGVQSLGATFEFDELYKDGPVTMRIAFADPATAKLALERLAKLPDDVAERSDFGAQIPGVLQRLRAMKATIEASEVVLRGSLVWDDIQGVAAVFWGAPPVRPLTRDERARLMRPLPAAQRN